jgi:hypothetical protein
LEIVNILLAANADPSVATTRNGNTAAFTAAQYGHLDVLSALVAGGAHTGTALTSNGATDLWAASWQGHTQMVQYLTTRENVEINQPRSDPPGQNLTPDVPGPGTTALWIAADTEHADIVQTLLAAGADATIAAADTGNTPLHAAAYRGFAGIVAQLAEHVSDLEVVDADGRTAWTIAARRRHTDTANVLLSAGAHEHAYIESESVENSDEDDEDRFDGLFEGHNSELCIGMGNRFDLEKSLASLDKIIKEGRKLDATELRARDPREEAYGEGVTRQWVHRTGQALLLSPQLFVESDSFPVITTDVSQKKKWKFKSVGLVVLALAKFQANLAEAFKQSTANLERTMSISPLSEPAAGSATAKQLVGVGRLLAIALVRKEPLGVLVSAPTCKLLLGGSDSVVWEDLAAVLPSKRFGAVLSCMDDVTDTERQIRLNRFKTDVLGWIEGFDEPVFEVESRASRRYEIAAEKRSTLKLIADDAARVPKLTADVAAAVIELEVANDKLHKAKIKATNDAQCRGVRPDAKRFHQCMRAVSALRTTESLSPVSAAKFALEWMASQATLAEDQLHTVVAACQATVVDAVGNVADTKLALDEAARSAGAAAIAAPNVAAAAAAAAAASVPRLPSRTDSAIDDGMDATFVDPTNVGDFIRRWAKKELVVNTCEQVKLVLQGVSDIEGGTEKLRGFSRGHQSCGDGWCALQQAIRGAVELDVKEWRAKTDHSYRGGPQSRAAADLFWQLVGELSVERKQKFLYFWCSEAPPAGGLSKLKERLQLRLEDPNGFFEAHTCFFQLHFPATTDPVKMQTMLDIAVEYWDKFGLE